jgi:hypothetical protein
MVTAAVSFPPGQPDIAYTPDFDKYTARTARRLATEKLHLQSLPDGFPSKLGSDFIWEGDTVKDSYDWIYELNENEINEIEEGLRHFQCP